MTKLQTSNLNIAKLGLYYNNIYISKMTLSEYCDFCEKVKTFSRRNISRLDREFHNVVRSQCTDSIKGYFQDGYCLLMQSLKAVTVFPTSIWVEVFTLSNNYAKYGLNECALTIALEIILGKQADLEMATLVASFIKEGLPSDHPMSNWYTDFDNSVKLAKRAEDSIMKIQREIKDFVQFISNQSHSTTTRTAQLVLSDFCQDPRRIISAINKLHGESAIAHGFDYGFSRSFSKYITNLNHNMRNDSYPLEQTEMIYRVLKELIFTQSEEGLCKNLHDAGTKERLCTVFEIYKGTMPSPKYFIN